MSIGFNHSLLVSTCRNPFLTSLVSLHLRHLSIRLFEAPISSIQWPMVFRRQLCIAIGTYSVVTVYSVSNASQ
jgi:hypothetical protein